MPKLKKRACYGQAFMTVAQKHAVPPLSQWKQHCRRGWILCDFRGSYTQVKIRWARDWRLKRTPDFWFSSNWIWNDYSYLKWILKSCCSYSTWRQRAHLFICSRGLYRGHCKYFGSESPHINNPNTNNIFSAAVSGDQIEHDERKRIETHDKPRRVHQRLSSF